MSSQLHQAVSLAQTGQRDEARQMLWQVVQTDPNNEIAWLWLASVAADQPEYVRALNEVLRVNPTNAQAQQLLAEFQQQYGAQAMAPRPVTPPPSTFGAPSTYGSPYQSMPPQSIRVETVKKHRFGCGGCGCGGCGCIQGCVIALVVMFILPIIACGALSYTDASLGPFDMIGSYLPSEFGRKNVSFDTNNLSVTLTVPRGWFVVDADDPFWPMLSDSLDQIAPFKNDNLSWKQFESAQGSAPYILETNPQIVIEARGPLGMQWVGMVEGDYSCTAVRARQNEVNKVYEYGSLCGTRTDTTVAADPAYELQGYALPTQIHEVTFLVPVTAASAAQWKVFVPEAQYDRFKSDLEKLIQTAYVKES